MARRKTKTGGPPNFDESKIVYFFLVTLTSKGRLQKDKFIQEEQRSVTQLVKQLGGKCELYSIQGPYDYISRVMDVTAAGAIQINQLIEAGGNVKSIIVPAFHIFK